MTVPTLLQELGAATLSNPKDGSSFQASTLWESRPAVVLVLRRPGCVLCRAEALKLWALRDQIEAAGGSLVCVVHEWREREIAAFAPEFWGGPLFHDTSKAFYKAVNGGEKVLYGTAMGLLNPWSAAWRRINEARKVVAKHNIVGEGLIMGGMLVIGAGGTGPFFCHVESDLGVHASHEEVLAAVKEAAAAAAAAATAPHPSVLKGAGGVVPGKQAAAIKA